MHLLLSLITLGYSFFSFAMDSDLSKLSPTQLTIKLYNTYELLTTADVESHIVYGADPNYTPSACEPTLLMLSMTRPIEHAQLLVKHKADLNKEVKDFTALSWAINSGNVDKVKLLLDLKPKKICLDHAVLMAKKDMIKLLIGYEKTINQLKSLAIALNTFKLDIVEIFLDYNIYTDVMIVRVVEQLIENPYDPNNTALFDLFVAKGLFSQKALDILTKEVSRINKEQNEQNEQSQQNSVKNQYLSLRSSTEILSKALKNIYVLDTFSSMITRLEALKKQSAEHATECIKA